MTVITVSGQFGAGGPAVGKRLAARLGVDYVDKEIIHRIALDLKVPEEQVAEFDELQHHRLRGFLSTVFDFKALRANTSQGAAVAKQATYDDRDEIPFDYRVQGWIDKDIYQQMMVRVVSAVAREGHAVIKGRGSQWILREHPEAIHVRFVAALEDRVRSTMARRQLGEAEARKLVEDMDQRGAEFVTVNFGCDLTDPTLYDLVLNTSRLSQDECLEILLGLVEESPPEGDAA